MESKMKYKYVLSLLTENTFDIFQRISIVFSRNRLFIQQLKFESIGYGGGCTFSIETRADEKTMERIINQLQNIFDLLEVNVIERTML